MLMQYLHTPTWTEPSRKRLTKFHGLKEIMLLKMLMQYLHTPKATRKHI